MYRFLEPLARLLTTHTPWFIIAAALIAFFAPGAFVWIAPLQTWLLGFIMLTMGLTLTAEDFKVLASRPLDIVLGACAQYTLMPLIAWGLTRLFQLDTALAVGIVLVGCCPGGVSSNIMSYLCKGDVAYSVGMTTVSTLLAPLVTPALVLWLVGEKVEVNALQMFLNILIVTIIPVAIGFTVNHFLQHRPVFQQVRQVLPAFSVIALALIVCSVVSLVHDHLVAGGVGLFLWTFCVVFCHNTLGYLAGYLTGKIARFNQAKKRTLSIEVGMQNAGLATALASKFFIVSCPLAVVPCAISCAWHSISGTILAAIFASANKKNH